MRRLMSRSDVVIAVWGLILLVIWLPTWAIWHSGWEPIVLLAMAVGVTWAKAIWTTLRARSYPEPGDRRPTAIVGTTHATSLVGVAIVCLALGLQFGSWLLYVGGGLLLVAIAGLVRERRASRRLMDAIGAGGRPGGEAPR